VKRAFDSDTEKGNMGRVKVKLALELVVTAALVLLMLLPACRKENPPLDRNKAPETFLTSSPTETTSTDYKVHMYWHGADEDGVVVKYIWYRSDTLMTLDPERNPDAEGLDWNPSERIADYLKGRFTTKTDTVIVFKGYDDLKGALVNRQAFHIAAVDDGGKIDPSPARLQFVARVRGIPIVRFWTDLTGSDVPYDPAVLDTISMFVPFTIKFNASTVNNVITGYRWSYSGSVFPDYNNDGSPDWLIPATQAETVAVYLPNSGNDVIPSGVFNFKGIARDEAGAISKSDLPSGIGVCKVVVNHDPDTEIQEGQCFYTPASTGVPESLDVFFNDAAPDTLPYNSLVRFYYLGWDDPKDRASLQHNNPPLPIRFQFAYNRFSIDEFGNHSADKMSPWYPLLGAEDTNPNAGISDPYRDRDSTTMRVGTFHYRFFARSFDEQKRPDGSPAVISFIGNFPPRIDSVRVGFYDRQGLPAGSRVFHTVTNDTIVIGWGGTAFAARGDTLCPAGVPSIVGTPPDRTITQSFKFTIRAGGHDDRRDPIGSGIKGWRYYVTNPVQDYTYYKEGEWQFDKPLNVIEQDCTFNITIPYPAELASYKHVVDSLVANPPRYLGAQTFEISGLDINDKEVFLEGIRGISPEYDADGNVIPKNDWIQNEYYFANYARRDTRRGPLYLKLVK
jgi:hypothetical protein